MNLIGYWKKSLLNKLAFCLTLFCFALFSNSLKGQTYTPPIGIPEPEFGINETHNLYKDSLYDFGNGSEPYKDAGNGPYTHYIDKNNASATDTDNPFGTPDTPRLTIPKNLTAGSVVEVHGGPYEYSESIHGGTYLPIVNATGTAKKPVFIRGASSDNRFEIGGSHQVIVRDVSYVIMENVLINDVALKIYQPSDHFTLRHSEVTGESSSGILIWTWKEDFTPGTKKEHLVFYDNKIHDNGPYPAAEESGLFGFMIDDATQNVWILDNQIYNNGDDGIQVIDRYWITNIDPNADRIFIGRNVMHHDGENAIDVKGATNVVLSQNEIYGYDVVFSVPSSAGEAIRINDEGDQDNIWILYNKIYNSKQAINPSQALSPPYIIGNIIYDCEIAINADAGMVINNTIVNTNKAVGDLSGDVINNIVTKADPTVFASVGGTSSNNLFWDNAEDESCSDCINADPLFTDESVKDFHLQPESPALENGIAHSVYDTYLSLYAVPINVDFDGNSRPLGPNWDIGPYEYEGSGVKKYYLSVSVSGKGSVSISPDSAGYSSGTVVTLTAVPDTGEQFIEWGGDLSGTDNPIQITMEENKTVTAFFSSPVTEDFVISDIGPLSDQFELNWNARATASLVDGVIGFSESSPTGYSDLSCKILFNNAGQILVSDGTSYISETTVSYSANQNFAFKMVVDMNAQTYSVWITPEGENEVLLATDYAFHSGPGTISSINYYSVKMSFDPQWGGAEGMVEIWDFNVVTAMNDASMQNIPDTYSLNSYPNPFNPSTTIEYTIGAIKQSVVSVELIVFDQLGRTVRSLVKKQHSPGTYKTIFDASDLSSGVYYYKLTVGNNFEQTKKLMLIR